MKSHLERGRMCLRKCNGPLLRDAGGRGRKINNIACTANSLFIPLRVESRVNE